MNILTVAPVFQSHMVLQRDKPVVIWGNASAQTLISVTLSNKIYGINETGNITVQNNGKWMCHLPPQKAGKNYTLSISCNETQMTPIILEDIFIGDIWLACGQSNMEFFLRYDEDWNTVKKYEKNDNIRMYNVPQSAFEGHHRNTAGSGYWFEEHNSAWEFFSAPGYSFARHIQPALNIPIGIIGCNWGGTTAAAWLHEDCLTEEPLSIYMKEYEEAVHMFSPDELKEKSMDGWEFEDSLKHQKEFMPLMYGLNEKEQQKYMKDNEGTPIIPMGPWNINRPGGLYHQMLEPLIPLSIKGVLWYQGESDAMHADIYDKLFTALITSWRSAWQDNFPFLFVQLAPFEKWLQCDATGYPEVRRRQEIVSKTVPDTAMTSIMDIGMYYDIHPKKKMEVGRRLALLARGKVYGESLLCEPPELIEYEKKDGTVKLTFTNCNDGLSSDSNASINGFHVKQKGREVPLTNIKIKEGRSVILESEELKSGPCTVSFAYSNYVEVNLWNEAGLPVKPFILILTDKAFGNN